MASTHNVFIKKKFTRKLDKLAIRYLFLLLVRFDPYRLIRKYLNTCVCTQ